MPQGGPFSAPIGGPVCTPIDTQKLRYFEDRNFKTRVTPPPALADGHYTDRPHGRTDDWGDLACRPDVRLACSEDDADMQADEGGLEQQRHPGLGEEAAHPYVEPQQLDLLSGDQDDGDLAADQRAMDRARGLGTIARGYGLNESSGRDLLPGL